MLENSEFCIVSKYQEEGFAIPLRLVERCVLVPKTHLLGQKTICVNGVEADVMMLCDKAFLEDTQDVDTMCVLCRKATQGFAAVCMGSSLHGFPFYVAELPIRAAPDEVGEKQVIKELESGFYIVQQPFIGSHHLSILFQHREQPTCLV